MSVNTSPPAYYPIVVPAADGGDSIGLVTRPWHDWFLKFSSAASGTDADLTALTASVTALSTSVSGAETDIAALELTDIGLAADIAALEADAVLLQSAITDQEEDTTAIYENLGSLLEDFVDLEAEVTAVQAILAPGISGTYTLAKITPGGADGSLTFTAGILTAATAPT